MANQEIKDLVDIIGRVPEKTFRMSEIAPQLLDEQGRVDIARVMDRRGELDLALSEMKTYIKGTRHVWETVRAIGGSPVTPDAGEFGGEDEENALEEDGE